MLDSDTANADANLHVEFYTSERDPYRGKPFVRIMVPGDKTNIIDTVVGEHHKKRFPRQWLYYQMQNNGAEVIGTPLAVWQKDRPEDINENQVAELTVLKFQTVEQVATASDSQMQKYGMGGIGLREKARVYLNAKNRSAASSESDELKAKLAKQEQEMAELREQMAQIIASQTPRRGRPPKEETV